MADAEELFIMADEIQKKITEAYTPAEQELVISKLSELTKKHVMAESQFNLLNARRAILTLANGEFNKIPDLVEAAKIDFRDVIYWVWLQENEKSK